MLRYVIGNLFSAPPDFSLAHCVSADLRMGAGIALSFREQFGQVDRLRAQEPKIGSFVFLRQRQRYIFYLVTKEYYYEKPTYEHLTLSLVQLCQFCLDRGIRKLALPKIGTGLDKLAWSRMEAILEEVFAGTDIEIAIYSLN
jgi:O-acetyl-ADP-ribose deacetylase (regulator of RNase III)